MMFLADCSQSLDSIKAEINAPVGQLITLLTGYKNKGGTFAIDNGAFSKFESKRFMAILEREKPNRKKCLFVCAPDVVGDARRTLEVFDYWYPKLERWPVALVAQDGLENLPIPWKLIACIFIGGSTDFKLSPKAAAIIKAGKAMDKWVHIGRVNTELRYDYFDALGADSFDGTGLSRYTHMRNKINEPNLLGPLVSDDCR